ncbi:LD-carboxypeptidase [Bizionia argentinensis JUB59]|uniref:LD-carboxypeptidase n=1 Tax=Bizionia argentinensis JUB59 TaxID=1046627 RepID=G2ECZ9_9FLAO|nr:LD-carboxypeptidase [Bizionia argentinensis]EGV43694.2 LD-carboxypeptidase [Bizionia argentinensis JUB59]
MSKISLILVLCFSVLFLGTDTAPQEEIAKQKTQKLIQPPYLKAGDTVAIVAPSGILKNRQAEVQRAVKLLKSWGLHAIVGKHVFSQGNHFAGTDAERCEDFQSAMDNPSVSAIWAARGGYGTVRILDKLDYTQIKKDPKWLIGYSDITALHNDFHNEGLETMHAMMCTSLTADNKGLEETIATFKKAIFGEPLSYALKGSSYNKIGAINAPIVGGNLTILHTMLGSKSSVDTAGKILFIEEIGEYKYHVDRMLQSLKRAGYFDNCAGVLVGDMSKMRRNTTSWGSSTEQLILDALAEYDFPIAFNMPAGHEDDNRAMIFGEDVELVVGKDQSTLKFSK